MQGISRAAGFDSGFYSQETTLPHPLDDGSVMTVESMHGVIQPSVLMSASATVPPCNQDMRRSGNRSSFLREVPRGELLFTYSSTSSTGPKFLT